MLLLSRKKGERIRLFDNSGNQIAIVVVHEIERNNVSIGFEASRDISIYREEVYQKNLKRAKENERLIKKLIQLTEEVSDAAPTVEN